ncbi:hypothetical protein BC937DRAFT_88669 [Endogone sp. FLAS-F59071]|nr:hypothetical protein BC937DRAFT_88669 [Endogone sp. FLAS-F59071]|eukprot:RUS22511.1 hypothetical protein BC937DRAFT_88669 [Endogone sp. FLAS-F59071]
MTTSSRTHSIQWSPHEGHNQFLVGSNDLRLYDCMEDDEGRTRISQLTVNSDLPLMKCFDWSPDPNYKDLVAVGFTNGRTILFRMLAESSPFPPIDAFPSSTPTHSDTIPSSQLAGHNLYSQPSTPRGPHPSTSTPSNPSYLALNVRHSRACNVVSFCPVEPHLLAAGLDKVRNEVSLMVWDVSQAQGKPTDAGLGGYSSPGTVPATPVMPVPPGLAGATAGVFAHVKVPSVGGWADRPPLPPGEGLGAKAPGPALDLGGEGFFSDRQRFGNDGAEYMTHRVNAPAPSHRTNDEPRPIQQYGTSEAITSCAWFPTGSPRLVAGMAMRFVRIYDMRVEGTNSSVVFSTKAVYGINVDPFHPHRFASYTEEGTVKIWDLTGHAQHKLLLTLIFMSIHVLTISADMTNPSARASATPGLSRISFSPTRSGLLATLAKESRVVRLWDIQEGFSRNFNASSSSATQRAPSITGAAGGITNPPSPFTNTVPGVAIPSGMGYPGLSPSAVGTVLVGSGVVSGAEMERGASNAGSGVSVDSNSGEEDAFDTPITNMASHSPAAQPSIKALSSFAWMPHSFNRVANASVHRLISVNKDGVIEAVRLQEALKFSWEPTGGLMLTGGGSLEQHRAAYPSSAIPNSTVQALTGGGSINGETQYQRSALRKQGLSMPRDVNGTPLLRITSQQQDSNFMGMGTSFQTNDTGTTDNSGGEPTPLVRHGIVYHRPEELQQRRAAASTVLGKPVHLGMGRARVRRSDRAAVDDAIIFVEDDALIRELQMDVSVVMRERALLDYSMDFFFIFLYSSIETRLRRFVLEFEQLASEGKTHTGTADYIFQGIHTVWMGPNAASQAYKKASPLSTPKTSSPLARQSAYQPTHANLTLQESTSSSSSTGTPASLSASSSLDHSATAAIAALNLSRGTTSVSPDDELAIVSTAHSAQRKLALWMCGFGFTKSELESELQSLESDGDFEKAAGWALFNGLPERAIKALNNSPGELLTDIFDDKRRKLMSAALAGYQSNTNQNKEGDGDTLWQSLARSLIDDLTDEPYLRTMFAYLASGDWRVVLEEKDLSLRERMAVALRVLSDDELTLYIEKLVRQMVTLGDIEGVFLTGLSKEGVDLFEQYVNITGDIQTAALVLSFCVPRKFQDKRVEEWVDKCVLCFWKALILFSTTFNFSPFLNIATARSLTAGNFIINVHILTSRVANILALAQELPPRSLHHRSTLDACTVRNQSRTI